MTTPSDNGKKPPVPPPVAPPSVPKVAPAVPSIAPGAPKLSPAVAPTVAPRVAPLVPPVAARVAPPPPVTGIPVSGPIEHISPAQIAQLEGMAKAIDALDYFEVLRIKPDAIPADIKKAFYRESRTYHPDRFFHIREPRAQSALVKLYKRITEAYYVLKDDAKRRRYSADITGPERATKLRFSEASEVETKVEAKKVVEEQIGTHPKARQFYKTAAADIDGERWSSAERNLKMALTFEPQNALYKEKLALVNSKLEAGRTKGDYRIK